MGVVKELAAGLQVELVPELGNSLHNVEGLHLQIPVVVKSNLVHVLSLPSHAASQINLGSVYKRRQSRDKPHKRGLDTKIYLAVDANGMPVRVLITEGTRADCKEAVHLIEGISAKTLLADRGYDTDKIIACAVASGMEVVIPPKRNRKEQRDYDRYLYRLRHLLENAFLHLKHWRGIAARYAKNTSSFLAAVQIRCIAICCAVLA